MLLKAPLQQHYTRDDAFGEATEDIERTELGSVDTAEFKERWLDRPLSDVWQKASTQPRIERFRVPGSES